MFTARLIVIGTVLRTRAAMQRLAAWLIEPAEARRVEKWRKASHARALSEMNALTLDLGSAHV